MKSAKILMISCVALASVLIGQACLNANLKLSIDIPTSFGKQHFIVGFPEERIEQERKKKIVEPDKVAEYRAEYGSLRVLFAPDDDVEGEILKVIEEEKESLSIAAFVFSNSKIAKALAEAADRGIKIVMLIDPTGFYERFSKVPFLKEHGIAVYRYNPRYAKQKQSSLLHHKFIVGKCNHDNKSIVAFGSANFSRAAVERNQDNVLFTSDPGLVERFMRQFERMQTERCEEGGACATSAPHGMQGAFA